MYRPIALTLSAFMLLAAVASGCDDAETPGPSEPPPTEITETFSLTTLTVNGAHTFSFMASRAGNITARFASLSGDGTIVGLSLGTWNGQVCQLIVTNDNASASTTVIGTATSIGSFCVRVYDVGKLTGPVDFEVTVSHF